MIVKPITEDGLVGFTESGTLQHTTVMPEGLMLRNIVDVRGGVCRMCDRGWQATTESLGDQSRVPWLPDPVHLSCRIRFEGLCERRAVRAAFDTAPFLGCAALVATENRYWSSTDPWSKKPWYRAELDGLELLVGMRKRVWHVEIRGDLSSWYERAEKSFEAEDVTKSFGPDKAIVHAWGNAELTRYIGMLDKAARDA